jgi:hypothetical protein
VNEAVFEYGMANLPVQLAEGLHLVYGDCRAQEEKRGKRTKSR